MNILLIFTFFIISGAVRCFDVIGYSGGSVLVDSHKPWYTDVKQYLYTWQNNKWNILIKNEDSRKWIKERRFTLFCTENGHLMIFIRDLNTQDSGTYRIGVEDKWSTKMSLKVTEDSCCGASQRVMVNTGQTANFTCQYSQDYKTNEKMIFKKGNEMIETFISTTNVKTKKERMNIHDDTQIDLLSVRITDVRSEDAGVYLCGVYLNKTSYSYSILTAVHLHIMMFGDEGGSAHVICPYDPIYKSKSKKLLKSCRDEKTLMEMNRWSVNDDMTASVFSVNITGLTAEDAGKYCCAVTLETDVIYLYTHLIILIKQELLLNKREGDNMSMECKHHAEYQKVFCKAHEVSMCVNDGVSFQWIRDDGFSLSDETSTGVFTVNISHLREEHSGIYWCGSHIITKVHLNVTRVSALFIILIITSVSVLLLMKTIILLLNLGFIRKISKPKLPDTHPSFAY
ncbi:polymeric immunoglobulin receptor-like isoform X3 [Triplophysa rosa]|uniref:polymeric immunoglobulin receptor-like isoform X3 n=1 Tax=Triplophysa rosa TaxID=992332 RepID=UPI002545CAAB|nr:polymeric immunoglobulin receptor-like isoform X3 [Triplophysa rosa]